MLLLCPIELAAGFEPAGPSRCDIVVKLTMTPGRHEVAVLATHQEPLSPTGSATFPPDAGRRPGAEVVIVGPALEDPTGPVSLRVGERVWNERAWRDLGPAAQPGGGHARPQQRLGQLDLPLLVEAKGRTWMKVAIPAPMPMFGIATAAGSPVRPIAARLEVLAIDPARRLLMLTFRAEISDTTARVVVNPNARATLPVAGELAWPEQTVAPLVAGAALSARPEPVSGLPFSRSKGLTVDAPRHLRSQALPFSRAPASAPPASAPPASAPASTPPSEPPAAVGFETVLM
ncbi:MAG: hypothetical protein HOV80_14295, partial [Polyangiaceae bacterium]|nr:hypothetical protein [Polyangiaceae bacterium]